MDRHYLLPVSLAAVLHVGLFFGIHPGSVPQPVKALTVKPPPFLLQLVAELEPPIERPDGDPEKSVALHPMAPTSADESPPRPDAIPMDVPTFVPRDATNLKDLTEVRFDLPGDAIGTDAHERIVMGMNLDKQPRTRSQIPPQYPIDAKRNGLTGEVLVEFVVDEGGHVIDPHVVKSTDRVFEDATVRAVSKWRFEPGRQGGRIVRFRMALPVVFSLNNEN